MLNKKKKIIIGIILIIIFALCFVPSQKINAKHKLNIVSSYGDNEAYHPKVLSFKDGWNGYKYWMSYTPYPKGDSSKENPHIAVSNDLVTWNTIKKLDEPIKKSKLQYNSDSHIVYNNDLNRLECYWRYVDDIENKSIIYRRYTIDGANWSEKEVSLISNPRSEVDCISPAILYENGIYKMWYDDKGNNIKYRTSKDGLDWSEPVTLNINYNEKVKTWHLDVIHTKEEYEMILVAFDNWKDHNKMSLYYTSSKDGINWNTANVIMKPTSKTNNWDNLGIYRSSFIYEDGKYYVFYGGTSKTLHHGVGLVYGEDIYHLKQFKKEK